MSDGPRAFVIGWPIAHSRSPLIHRYWLGQLHISGSYERIPVAPPDLPDFLGRLGEHGLAGGNVTLPHKAKAFALCATTTPTAARLEAVNTLWLEGGKLHGDNTDVAGFLGAIDHAVPAWDQSLDTVVVLGAGGAARAIIEALHQRGATAIHVANRTRARGEALQSRFGNVELVDRADLPQVLAAADLLVNTTSLGMAGHPALDIDIGPLPPSAIVADIVYVPLETALLRQARARGLRTCSGLGMLLHQAVPGFARWFGQTPKVTPQLQALVAADVGTPNSSAT